MQSIISLIMLVLMGVIGGVSTVAITALIPVTIGWKFYRKAKFGYALTR